MCCTVCKSGPRGGACVLYCLQIWPPVAPMCCTVSKSGPREGANVLYCLHIWLPGGANVVHCLQIWPPGAPMSCIVSKSGPRVRQCAALSANLASEGTHPGPVCKCAGVRVCGCGGAGPGNRHFGQGNHERDDKKIGGANVLYCLQIWPRGGPGLRCRASHLRRRAPHLGSSHPADVASRPCCCSISSMSLCCAHELAVQYAIQLLPFNRQRSGGRRSLCPPLIKPGLMCSDATLRFLNFN